MHAPCRFLARVSDPCARGGTGTLSRRPRCWTKSSPDPSLRRTRSQVLTPAAQRSGRSWNCCRLYCCLRWREPVPRPQCSRCACACHHSLACLEYGDMESSQTYRGPLFMYPRASRRRAALPSRSVLVLLADSRALHFSMRAMNVRGRLILSPVVILFSLFSQEGALRQITASRGWSCEFTEHSGIFEP